MSQELLNTSAPRGVKPGSTGFCTVGVTAGMSPVMEERLTLLSGYRWLVPPGEKNSEQNPVAWAHWRLAVGGRTLSVLSRVCDAGFDYSRRSNRFAHHVVIDPSEQAPAGPAWVMLRPGVMREGWAGEPQVFPAGPDIPQGSSESRACEAWQTAAGDAGWAGVLAEAFVQDPTRAAYVLYPRGMPMLPLIDEALTLLPPAMRWQVTFSTYFTDLPAGMGCAWRCCVAGTRPADEARRNAGSALVIDLTQPLGNAPEGPSVRAARSGNAVEAETAPKPMSQSVSAPRYAWQGPDPEENEAGLAAVAMARAAAAAESAAEMHESPDALEIWARDAASAASTRPRAAVRRGTHPAFWVLAVLWPVAAAGGLLWYLGRFDPKPEPAKPALIVGKTAPATEPAVRDGDFVPAALQQATIQKLQSSEQKVQEQGQALAQMRDEMTKLKNALAAARNNSPGPDAATAELAKLKADYAALELKLKTATDPGPATVPVASPVLATAQAAAAGDRAVEVLRDEVELWPGDGGGAPDALQLDGSKPPDSLLVERTPARIVFKLNPPSAGAHVVAGDLGLIKVDGGRVVLEWIGPNRQQFAGMSGARAWLQFSRLQVLRKGQVVAGVRFLPLRTFSLNVEREAPVSLLPDVHWKPALQRVALAPPTIMPDDWSAKQKDDQTLTLSNTKTAGAAFDVQLVLSSAGELKPQTTWAAALADALASKQADDSAAALRAMPAMTIPVINRDSGTVLCTVQVKRGGAGRNAE